MRRPTRDKLAQNRDKARRDKLWAKHYKPTRWYEVDKWASEHEWKPILDCNYSEWFDFNCKQYSHYFDVVRGDLGEGTNEEFASLKSDEINHPCTYYFTVLEEDLFSPNGFYVGPGDKPIVFDSEYSIALTPFKDDFIGEITPVKKDHGWPIIHSRCGRRRTS